MSKLYCLREVDWGWMTLPGVVDWKLLQMENPGAKWSPDTRLFFAMTREALIQQVETFWSERARRQPWHSQFYVAEYVQGVGPADEVPYLKFIEPPPRYVPGTFKRIRLC